MYGGQRTGVSTDAAIKWYLAQGATASKITLGMPLYGRAFENTNGIGQPFSGVSQILSYRALSSSNPSNRLVPELLKLASTLTRPFRVRTLLPPRCLFSSLSHPTVAGAQIYENTTDVTSYSYDSAKKELVSYDTPNIVKLKSQYINSKGLAGSMFWELSTDRVGAQSLVGVSAAVLGALDQTPNHLKYVWYSSGGVKTC